ncbi:MAG: adenosylmethionine--8-amino-7-oxononanoate transaminase [Mariprofundaceae bacterium]
MTGNGGDWLEFERRHVWHPYALIQEPAAVFAVERAQGVRLHLQDGRALIDGMASWWSAIHGYNVPELNDAAAQQLEKMAHVMFGGLTHRPAADLAGFLLEMAPKGINRVFFADSGSVSVEISIKMAIQYWNSQKKTKKNRLLTIRHGYHGDTFGAMGVCDPESGMHHLFSSILPQHIFADAPANGSDADWDASQIADFGAKIKRHHNTLAAVILEPVIQGAGGMRIYAAEFLRRVRALCDEYDVLLIVDEIATGFGRSGKMFACEHAGISPDIMCVGKALTGGYMSLAVVLTSDKVARGVESNGNVLMHGPTFMANPLACAIALANLRLLVDSPWQKRVAAIEKQLRNELEPCRSLAQVADVRVKGAVGVVELKKPVDMAQVQPMFVEKGVWIRPFGKLIYIMPPYIISAHDLSCLTRAMREVAAL